jgi:hypothetical protein
MSRSIPPIPQYAFMAWCSVKKCTGTALPLSLCIVVDEYNWNHLIMHFRLYWNVVWTLWKHWLTNSRSKDLLQKLIIAQLDNKFPAFMAPKDALSRSREPATDSHPEPTGPNSYLHTKIRFNNILSSTLNPRAVIAQSVWRSATGRTIGVLGFESRRGLGIFLFTSVSRTVLRPTQPPI